MDKRAIQEINFEVGEIDRLFEIYSDLIIKIGKDEPDLIELTAMSAVIHSFYNGLEKIFLTFAKRIEQKNTERRPMASGTINFHG